MKIGPREMEDNVISVEDLDMSIYRIFKYERFKQLIENKELVLVNPSKWDDPFENFFLKTQVDCGDNEIATLNSLAADWYGQCWTTNSDTDAMWRIYSGESKDGIRVKTTVRKLFSSVFDAKDSAAGLKYFIGSVEYKDKEDIMSFMRSITFTQIASGQNNDAFAQLLCIKRTEFQHESEIRILVNDIDKRGKNGCYKIPFSHSTLDEICIDPRISEDCFSSLSEKIKSLGVDFPIIQSDLYKIELPIIRL